MHDSMSGGDFLKGDQLLLDAINSIGERGDPDDDQPTQARPGRL